MTTLVSSYVTLSDAEVEAILGEATEASWRRIEEHIVEVAVALTLRPERPQLTSRRHAAAEPSPTCWP